MSNEGQLNKSEHDFFELLHILVNNIKLIIAVTLVFFFIGFAYINIGAEKIYHGSVNFKKIGDDLFSEFNVVNEVIRANTKLYENIQLESNVIPSEYWMTKEKLENYFINEFLKYEILFNNFSKHYSKDENIEPNEAANMSLNGSQAFDIDRSESKFIDSQIIFSTKNTSLYEEILHLSLNDIYLEIYGDIINDVESIIASIDYDHVSKLDALYNDLEVAKSEYLIRYEARLRLLSEQVQIARSLGIAEGDASISTTFNTERKDDNTLSTSSLELSSFDYFRGYIALDEEIKILKQRDISQIQLYDESYASLLSEIQRLDKNQRSENIRNAIETLPNIESFKPILINLESISYEVISRDKMILILSFLIGIFFSCFYVLMNNRYKSYIKTIR